MFGTTPKEKGIFLSRAHALLDPPKRGYPSTAAEVRLRGEVVDVLRQLTEAGMRLFLIGNELEVASGEVSFAESEVIQACIERQLHDAGVSVTRNFVCRVHPEAEGVAQGDSVFRMPNVGAFKAAQQEFEVDPTQSWLIGTRSHEILAAERAGAHSILVQPPGTFVDDEFTIEPDVVTDDARTALHVVRFEESRLLR